MQLGTVQAVDLNLFLFDRPLHPELFQHYADHRVRQGRYYADIWITGLSHVITVTLGDRSLTEVVTGNQDVLPTRGVLTRFRIKGERDAERQTSDGWRYMVSSQIETMVEPLYKSVHNDLLRHALKRGWHVSYDQLADGEMTPFSYIDHEARDREFHIHAFHAFPLSHTLVKTQSIIELPA